MGVCSGKAGSRRAFDRTVGLIFRRVSSGAMASLRLESSVSGDVSDFEIIGMTVAYLEILVMYAKSCCVIDSAVCVRNLYIKVRGVRLTSWSANV